jgi:DNA-directed RNA polymerase subunit H (RpoH/RPB5)
MSDTLHIPLLQSRLVLLKHLRSQGYDTSGYDSINVNHIANMMKTKQLDMLFETKTSDTKKKVYVHYFLGSDSAHYESTAGKTKSVSTKKPTLKSEIPKIIDDIFVVESVLTKNDNLIIIIDGSINAATETTLRLLFSDEGYFIIIFDIKTLQYDITDHILYNPHRILSDKETSEVMTQYNILSRESFPEICRFDACAKVIGIRPGEVCEITRPSKTAITTLYYRICIN